MTAIVANSARLLVPDLANRLRATARSSRLNTSAEEARTDRVAFVRFVMQDERGESITADAFTRLFCDCWGYLHDRRKTQARQHMSFTAPPGLGKSSLARMMLLHAIGQDPTTRSVITSGDMGDSTNAVSLCRQVAMSPMFQEVFPGCEPDASDSADNRGWTQKSWFLKSHGQQKDPTMQAMPAVPKRESVRIDALLADDIVTHKTRKGADHESICSAFFNTYIEGRCRLGGLALYLQNLREKDDLLHRLRAEQKFVSVWVGVTEDCERLFLKLWNAPDDFPPRVNPERYGLNIMANPDADEPQPQFYAEWPLPVRPGYTVEDLRATSPGSFRTMFRLRGLDASDLMMPGFSNRKRLHQTAWSLLGVSHDNGRIVIPDQDQFRFRIVAGLDISGVGRSGTAFCAVAENSQRERVPIEIWSMPMDFVKLVQRLDDAWRRGVRWEKLVVETNGVQIAVQDAVKATASERGYEWANTITGTVTGSNKWDPSLGLPGLDVKFQNGAYVWPDRMSTHDVPEQVRETWRRAEASWATLTRGASRLATPDDLMALWFADAGLDRAGYIANTNAAPVTSGGYSHRREGY